MLFVSKLITVTEQEAVVIQHLLKTMSGKPSFKSEKTTNKDKLINIYSPKTFI